MPQEPDNNPLIPRIEQATAEQVRELLEEAFEAVHGWTKRQYPKTSIVRYNPLWIRFRKMLDAEAWTSAAELLVPEGWGCFDVDATAPECGIDWRLHGPNREAVMGTDSTPALALAAACLRAKGLQAESHSGTCTA